MMVTTIPTVTATNEPLCYDVTTKSSIIYSPPTPTKRRFRKPTNRPPPYSSAKSNPPSISRISCSSVPCNVAGYSCKTTAYTSLYKNSAWNFVIKIYITTPEDQMRRQINWPDTSTTLIAEPIVHYIPLPIDLNRQKTVPHDAPIAG